MISLAAPAAASATGDGGGSPDPPPDPAALQQELTSSATATQDSASSAEQTAAQTIETPASDPADSAPASGDSEQSARSEAGSVIDQEVGASAAAAQVDPENVVVVVNVGEPARLPAVIQQNQAQAHADATGIALVAGSPSDQDVQAAAAASQGGAENTYVEIRIDSPGPSGTVTQVNAVAAQAAAAADPSGGSVATTAANQEAPGNVSVSIRVDSPGDAGAVTQVNSAQAGAAAASAEATASQAAAQNTNVSIRLDSPGADGPVTQVNSVDAAIEIGSSVPVTVQTGASSTNVAVDLAGGIEIDVPAVWSWTWEWTWSGAEPDWEQVTAAVAAELAAGDWDWGWTWAGGEPAPGDSGASIPAGQSTESQYSGVWSWEWTWEQSDVPAWDWSWSWLTAAPCDCMWTWEWSWLWTGLADTSAEPEEVVAAVADADLEQTNTASADASASGVVEIAQIVSQGQEGAESLQTQDALQLVVVTQTASASSVAAQVDVWNFADSVGGDVVQSNAAQASTEASAWSSTQQEIAQSQIGAGSDQAQWAGQLAEIVQSADAAALAAQDDTGNWSRSTDSELTQTNAASALAVASTQSNLAQVVWQDQLGAASIQSQEAGQLAYVEQAEQALAEAVQAETANWNLSTGGAFSQLIAAQATASATALSTAAQTVDQVAVGEGTVQLQEAWQVLDVLQSGLAAATAAQSQVGNTNVFFAPPAVTDPPAGTAPPGQGWTDVPTEPMPADEPPAPPGAVLLEAGSAAGDLSGGPTVEQRAGPMGSSAAASTTTDQVSVSDTGSPPATASLVRRAGGLEAVDTGPDEVPAPPPAPAPESGARAGSVDGAPTPSGPAATAARYALAVPELAFPQSMPAVRRPALSGSALERPG